MTNGRILRATSTKQRRNRQRRKITTAHPLYKHVAPCSEDLQPSWRIFLNTPHMTDTAPFCIATFNTKQHHVFFALCQQNHTHRFIDASNFSHLWSIITGLLHSTHVTALACHSITKVSRYQVLRKVIKKGRGRKIPGFTDITPCSRHTQTK